jgi:hypothetical protein
VELDDERQVRVAVAGRATSTSSGTPSNVFTLAP